MDHRGAAAPAGDAWMGRYEALRHEWLARLTSCVEGWSMTLLVQRGMAAWMNAWPKPTPSSPRSLSSAQRAPDVAPSLPSGLGQELATVMVSMILGRSKEFAA